MPLAAGTRLGPYEVLAPIGSGGMGEVYRARDTRLNRDVALKVLPPEVTSDPSRRARFEQEARVVAALNHPNIMSVHDVGSEDGVLYIVTEVIDGESLRGASFGLRKTLDVAIQITSGLAAAHEAGIVHRDLKPDNILLTRDGHVKILDFGLAKTVSQKPGADGATETLTVQTEPGMVMGTVSYMSPEQVRGKEVDYRSDFFSLGLILHEMLTGKRTFQGETSADTMTAILKDDSPELPESVPIALRQIVAHCLEKDPTSRFQSARDLGFALKQVGSRSGPTPVLARRSPWLRQALVSGSALLLVAVGISVGWLVSRSPRSPSWSGVLLGGPENALCPRVSPDGHLLAFVSVIGEDSQVAVMKPESGNYSILTHDRTRGPVMDLSWSRDGTRIYYDRQTGVPRGVFSVPALGGEAQLVLEDAGVPEALPDGSLLIARLNEAGQFQLFRYWPETGRSKDFPFELTAPVTVEAFMLHSFPDGREAIAIGMPLGGGRELGPRPWIIDLSSGAMRPAIPASQHGPFGAVAVTPDGKSVLVVIPSGSLYQVVSFLRDGKAPGQPLFSLMNHVVALDAAPDGNVYVDQVERPISLVRFSRNGGHVQRITALGEQTQSYPGIASLPDGRIVVTELLAGTARLVIVEAGKDPVQFLQTSEQTQGPLVLAGPSEIVFLIGPNRGSAIAVASLSSGRILRRIPFDKGPIDSIAAAPDGRMLYFASSGSIWSVPSIGGEPRQIGEGSGLVVDPDSQSLIIMATLGQSVRLFRVPWNGGARQEILLKGLASLIRDLPITGRIGSDGAIVASGVVPDSWFGPPVTVDLASGKVTRIRVDLPADYNAPAWTSDGQIAALAYGLRSALWRFQQKVGN